MADTRENAPQGRQLLGLKPTLGVLLRRDGYVCAICRHPFQGLPEPLPSDPEVLTRILRRIPRTERPSRDHIIPQAHGGFDCHANLRAVHVRCNSQKSDRIPHWAEIRYDLLTPHSEERMRHLVKRVSGMWGPAHKLHPALGYYLRGGAPPIEYALA